MQSPLSEFERRQLDVIARVTPHAMAGHILNTTVLAIAVANSIPIGQLAIWCTFSFAIALFVIYRRVRNRRRVPQSFAHARRRATLYAFFLALPWSSIAVLQLGALAHDQELILVALGVGMAASGTVLLSAIPTAAFVYMSAILLPTAVKCAFLFNEPGYLLLGILAISFWGFLAAVIAKTTREISDRKRADDALKESEARLQEALTAGQVVAFTWDPVTRLSHRSENASEVLGFEPRGETNFLAQVHPGDRACFAAQVAALSPQNPSYSASFRFIRPDGQEVWLEETGRAEFNAEGRYLRLKGLTRDITEPKRAEERQRLLIRELDHRVKNVLASVAAVAQRTREGSASMDEFLQLFEGRIQSMANAQALLSRSNWQGVGLADLVQSELAPWVEEAGASVEGPEVLLAAEATQPMAIVLHELVTNASKYGALTTPRGRISVRWDLRPDGWLLLEWTETGGPAVVASSQEGYGAGAIRDLIPYELGGLVELTFAPGGVHCRIELPSTWIRSDTRPRDLSDLKMPDPDSSPVATSTEVLPW